MRMMVKCPEHGVGAGTVEGDEVIIVTGGCGCRSRPYGSGTRDEGGCPEHGRSRVLFTDAVTGGSGRGRFSALLECGCAGDLWLFGSLSLFRRKEASR